MGNQCLLAVRAFQRSGALSIWEQRQSIHGEEREEDGPVRPSGGPGTCT